jgi:hypothetical protein
MDNNTINKILNFLVTNEGKKLPGTWIKFKLENNIPLTKEELNVKGNLDLSDSQITQLPEGLKVGGDLYLNRTNIKSLPEGLKVGGNLSFLKCKNLTLLPKGLDVGGWLVLRGTNIIS